VVMGPRGHASHASPVRRARARSEARGDAGRVLDGICKTRSSPGTRWSDGRGPLESSG
jgi:hypothetical protein